MWGVGEVLALERYRLKREKERERERFKVVTVVGSVMEGGSSATER